MPRALRQSLGHTLPPVRFARRVFALVRVTAACAVLLVLAGCSQRTAGPAPAARTAQAPREAATADALCAAGHDRLDARDYAGAAEAFDACSAADATRAYAYYYAGMAYRELRRFDLMSDRFEVFIKLAPDAPERPRVQAILRSLSG